MSDFPLPEPDILRRLLLLLLTIILVARPLVWGEDTGLVSDFSDASGLALVLMAIIAAAAWGGWRLVNKQSAIYLGPVDYALLALSLLLAVGVGGLGYRRAGMLAGWEWFALGLLLVLVRQLAVRPEDKQGILCVLLATAVGLSAQGAYQALRDIPVAVNEARVSREVLAPALLAGSLVGSRSDNVLTSITVAGVAASPAFRGNAGEPDLKTWIRSDVARRGVNPSALEVMQIEERLEKRQVHGPYFHPESLAGILVLSLPALLAGLLASVRAGANSWQTIALAACVLLAGAILWMTGVRTALCALGAVFVGAVCLAWPSRMSFGVRAALAASLTLGTFTALALIGPMATPIARAREVWPAAWRLFEQHFWLGVGPAQFAFFYPRYMAETAGPRVTEPSNFLLEIGTTGGVFALVMLVLATVLFVRALLRWRTADLAAVQVPVPPTTTPAPETPPTETPVRWEFYLGGMIGLVMAFVFRAGTLDRDDILPEALRIGVHAVVWFGAFALFEGIAWTEGEYIGGLCAGIVALLLMLLFEGGASYSSVTSYLWVSVALVLAVVAPQPAAWLSRQPLLLQLPVPILLAVAFGFFAFVGYPPTGSSAALRKSQYGGVEFLSDVTGKKEDRKIRDLPAFVRKRIIEPLETAQKDDKNNVRLMTELSGWYGQLWALNPDDEKPSNAGQVAVAWAKLAQKANPEWVEGYRAEFDVRIRIASVLNQAIATLEKDVADAKRPVNERAQRRQLIDRIQLQRQQQYRLAAEALAAYLAKDKTNPELHMRLASALYEAKSPVGPVIAKEARRLDHLVKPPRGLSDPQRQQLEKWLGKESEK